MPYTIELFDRSIGLIWRKDYDDGTKAHDYCQKLKDFLLKGGKMIRKEKKVTLYDHKGHALYVVDFESGVKAKKAANIMTDLAKQGWFTVEVTKYAILGEE